MLTSEEKGLAVSAGLSWIRNTEGLTAHPPTGTHRHTVCPPGTKDVPGHVPRTADTNLGGAQESSSPTQRGARAASRTPQPSPQPRWTLP